MKIKWTKKINNAGRAYEWNAENFQIIVARTRSPPGRRRGRGFAPKWNRIELYWRTAGEWKRLRVVVETTSLIAFWVAQCKRDAQGMLDHVAGSGGA